METVPIGNKLVESLVTTLPDAPMVPTKARGESFPTPAVTLHTNAVPHHIPESLNPIFPHYSSFHFLFHYLNITSI